MMGIRFLHVRILALLAVVAGCSWYEVDGPYDHLTNQEVCGHLYYDCNAVTSLDTCGLNFMVVTRECLRAIMETPCDFIGDQEYALLMDACFPPCSEEKLTCDGNLLRICKQMDILREEVHDCEKKCEQGIGECRESHGMMRCLCWQ